MELYCSVEQADEYFAVHLRSDEWDELPEYKKEAALNAATQRIDAQRYQGVKATVDQDQAFPRCVKGICDEGIPLKVKHACAEEALYLAVDAAQDRAMARGVTQARAGDASETYADWAVRAAKDNRLSSQAKMLLSQYLAGTGAII